MYVRLSLRNCLFAVTRTLKNEVGRTVGNFFFLLKFPIDRYFWILVAEAGKILLFFVPIFSVHNTENNFVFEAISSFIQKKKICIKIEFRQLSEKSVK